MVSTPYLYAQEVLAQGRGLLVPFADSQALAEASLRYLDDAPFRMATQRRAQEYAKAMLWPNVGRQYYECFRQVVAASQPRRTEILRPVAAPSM